MLMRCCLNSEFVDIDEVANLFIAKKQKTFDQYVRQKEEYYEKRKKESGN